MRNWALWVDFERCALLLLMHLYNFVVLKMKAKFL